MLRLSTSYNRVVDSLLPIIQIVAAATGAYAIAHYGLGHATPLLAATVTISSLGFVRDARPVRVLESALGIVIGIAVSELVLQIVGKGVWQIAFALFITLLAARLLSASNAFAVAAGVQSMIVLILPLPEGGPFQRTLDGLIAGVVALIVTAVIPRDPRRLARREARRLFAVFTESLTTLAVALDNADEPAADRALEKLRATQPLIDSWTASLDSARAIARISPFMRRHTDDLEAQARMLHGMDLATRNLRVIARRIDFLVRDGEVRPALGGLVATITTSVNLLGQSIDDPVLGDTARLGLAGIAAHLTPQTVVGDAEVTDSVIILMLRPMLVDLLVASGLSEEKARATLPVV